MAISTANRHDESWDVEGLVRSAAFKNMQMARDPKRTLGKTLLQRQFWYALKADLEMEAAQQVQTNSLFDGLEATSDEEDDLDYDEEESRIESGGLIIKGLQVEDESSSCDITFGLKTVDLEQGALQHELLIEDINAYYIPDDQFYEEVDSSDAGCVLVDEIMHARAENLFDRAPGLKKTFG